MNENQQKYPGSLTSTQGNVMPFWYLSGHTQHCSISRFPFIWGCTVGWLVRPGLMLPRVLCIPQ